MFNCWERNFSDPRRDSMFQFSNDVSLLFTGVEKLMFLFLKNKNLDVF